MARTISILARGRRCQRLYRSWIGKLVLYPSNYPPLYTCSGLGHKPAIMRVFIGWRVMQNGPQMESDRKRATDVSASHTDRKAQFMQFSQSSVKELVRSALRVKQNHLEPPQTRQQPRATPNQTMRSKPAQPPPSVTHRRVPCCDTYPPLVPSRAQVNVTWNLPKVLLNSPRPCSNLPDPVHSGPNHQRWSPIKVSLGTCAGLLAVC
ncbi:hypothetical protein DFJ74DRAFT_685334 [Hyaloraphidium curvatum]|nr:hypothetical protein DFJ74DRAFT_685334 [Hyaloraphidium curvatum]